MSTSRSSGSSFNGWTVFRAVRTPVTLLLLLGILVYGAWWGYKHVLIPIPTMAPAPCQTQQTKQLKAEMVTLNVYNGGYQRGIASDVAQNLKNKGFDINRVGNTDERIEVTVIRGASPTDPEVKLVAGFFPGAKVEGDNRPDHTVDVLVGNAFAPPNYDAPTQVDVPSGSVCLPASASPSATPTPTPTK